MSLLMQALKKAEQAKQKQLDANDVSNVSHANSQTEQVEISISEKEKIDKENEIELERELKALAEPKMSLSELSLTPQQDEHIHSEPIQEISQQNINNLSSGEDEFQKQESDFNHKDINGRTEPIINQVAEHAADSTTEATKSSEQLAHQLDSRQEITSQEKKLKDIIHPKVNAEQKELAEKNSQQRIVDQQKARAVFSSKTSHNPIKLKWPVILSIAGVVVLSGLAYTVWKESNIQHQNFPTNLSIRDAVVSHDISSVVEEGASQGTDLPTANQIKDHTHVANVSNEKLANTKEGSVNQESLSTSNQNNNSSHQKELTNTDSILKNKKDAAQVLSKDNASIENSSSVKNKIATKNTQNELNAIQIRKEMSGDKVNPLLVSAYQAYTSGDHQLATTHYQKLLLQDPNNREALVGMAALAIKNKQLDQAANYYGKLLTLDPNDPDAIAGITSLQSGDPVQGESRLKAALAQNPNAGAILFTLANLYAQQSRWSDAQQAYFRAYGASPNNADYAFNLAVSLDRLSQKKLAIEYYQKAIALSKSNQSNFNLNKVQQRVNELESIRDQ